MRNASLRIRRLAVSAALALVLAIPGLLRRAGRPHRRDNHRSGHRGAAGRRPCGHRRHRRSSRPAIKRASTLSGVSLQAPIKSGPSASDTRRCSRVSRSDRTRPPPWTSRLTNSPVAARRDRHHRHRRATEARGGECGVDHRRRLDHRDSADHRDRRPDLGAGGGSPGAQERRHRRHRHPHPDPRLQQHLALQRAAVLHRRHPDGERLQLSTLDIGGFGAGDRSRPVPDQRSQPRRHRVHRDREGAGRGDALRHPGLERRGPDHHQAGPGGQAQVELSSPSSARVSDNNKYPLNYFGRATLGS